MVPPQFGGRKSAPTNRLSAFVEALRALPPAPGLGNVFASPSLGPPDALRSRALLNALPSPAIPSPVSTTTGIDIVQNGRDIIPARRDPVALSSSGWWDVILQPGRAWNESADNGYTRFAQLGDCSGTSRCADNPRAPQSLGRLLRDVQDLVWRRFAVFV